MAASVKYAFKKKKKDCSWPQKMSIVAKDPNMDKIVPDPKISSILWGK